MSEPLFSVLIPTFNRAHLLPRAINSVLYQSYANFELIIIDDGSFDQTKEIIDSYIDTRIRYLKHEKNLGQNCALNTGLGITKGDFVSFLDSDDEWHPKMLETVLNKFNSPEQFDCVYTSYAIKPKSGKVITPVGSNFNGFIYKEALEECQISPPSALSVRRRCFEVIGNFEPNVIICQDDILCLKLAKTFKFGHIDEVLATLHYDSGAHISDDPYLTAQGYHYLYNFFAEDIIKHCGPNTMAKHYLHSGQLFFGIRDYDLARLAFEKSLANKFSIRALSYLGFALLLKSMGLSRSRKSRRP